MKINLVTLQDARDQVNLDQDLDDRTLERLRTQASGVILDYIKDDVDVFDTAFNWVDDFGEPTDNVPSQVATAVYLVIGALYENRDGDVFRAPQIISQSVIDVLMRTRTPALK